MKITEKIFSEDKSINDKIRKFGIRKLSRKIGISPAYLCDLLNNRRCISKEKYLKIKKEINFERIR